jgi:hypothetical protein
MNETGLFIAYLGSPIDWHESAPNGLICHIKEEAGFEVEKFLGTINMPGIFQVMKVSYPGNQCHF